MQIGTIGGITIFRIQRDTVLVELFSIVPGPSNRTFGGISYNKIKAARESDSKIFRSLLLAFGELPVLNAITGEQTCDVLTPSRASGYGLLE